MKMGRTLDFILAFGALVIGIMFLTGNGGIFMKGGNDKVRKEQYDEKKMEKATGIALLIAGLATAIDSYTTGVAAKSAYLIIIVLVFGGLFWYIKTRCRKKK